MNKDLNLKQLAKEYWDINEEELKDKGVESFKVFYEAASYQFKQIAYAFLNYDFDSINLPYLMRLETDLAKLYSKRVAIERNKYLSDEQKLERFVVIDNKVDELVSYIKNQRDALKAR